MSSSTPFYRQLNSRFIIIASLFLLIVILLSALLVDRENRLKSIVSSELSEIETLYQQQVTIQQSERLLDKMINNKNSAEMLTQHQQLVALLTAVQAQASEGKREIALLVKQQKAQSESIKRLSNNHGRNEQLSQSAAIQMQLVIDELKRLKQQKEIKQRELYQQILEDKAADSVTSSRAKAHAVVTTDLTLLTHTETAVIDVFVLFNQLSLKYSLADYDHFTGKLEQSLTQWSVLLNEVAHANEDEKKLLLLLSELQNLLYTEQNTVAKWRGHIRVAQEYADTLLALKNKLIERSKAVKITGTVGSLLPGVIQDYVSSKYHPKHQYFLFGFYAMIVVIGALLLFNLSMLRSKIRIFAQSQVNLVSSTLTAEKSEVECHSFEQAEIVKQLSTVVLPKHSEADFQSLAVRLAQFNQILLDEGKVAVVETKDTKQSTSRFVQHILFGDSNDSRHWRAAFSKQNVRLIITELRKAKSSKEPVQILVDNVLGDNLNASLSYKNGSWQGVIKSQPEQKILVAQLNQLENDLVNLGHTNQTSQQVNASQLKKMLVRAMLKSQNVSINSGGTSLQVYRQLNRILDWSRQLEISSVLKNASANHEKVDVNIEEELAILSCNILHEAHIQRNKVTLNLDSALLMQGRIHVRLFHRMLQGLAKACLQETFKSTLALSLNVIDKNAGQQMVKFSLAVHTSDSNGEVPNSVQALVACCGDNDCRANTLFEQYMQTMFNVNHCSNTQVSNTDFGFQLTFDMAMTLSDEKRENPQEKIDLKATRFAMLSGNELLNQQMKIDIQTRNGQLESYHKIEHLTKALTSKLLNAHPVVVVLVSSDMMTSHLHAVEQHLNTLAKPIRPKLLVLQPHFSSTLHKNGLYNDSDYQAGHSDFVKRLAHFYQSNQADNKCISPEIFKQYSFEQTQVEVLIATHQLEECQLLSRILYWLGLQVTFVSHPELMLKQWQSGRFLILISGLDESPVVEVAVGKNVSRALISLNDGVAKLFESNAIPKSWHSGRLPSVLDIDELVRLLKPWLKEHVAYEPANKGKVITAKQPQERIESKESKIATLDLTPADTSSDAKVVAENQVFDIAGYARNQGSPELAVYMLDTYLDEINDAIINIEQALTSKDYECALTNAEQLIVASKILTASELTKVTYELTEALKKKSLKKAKQVIEQLNHRNQDLIKFSQAI